MPQPQSTEQIWQHNSEQLKDIIKKVRAVQNPVAYLQSQAYNSPLIKRALELGQQYNGDYDAATRALLIQNNIDPKEVQSLLTQLFG